MQKRCGNFVASNEGQELAVLCLKCGYRLVNRVRDLTRIQIEFLLTAANFFEDNSNKDNSFRC